MRELLFTFALLAFVATILGIAWVLCEVFGASNVFMASATVFVIAVAYMGVVSSGIAEKN